ncbi:TerB N-terminal domain-containing protein [Limosilactobacillus fastidiosus]|uniref:TerB N-terminal domain-containing protein n=1 Tax=Limosilactobacillus fastidiosus TaxID=2759855 RepID=A0A7W3YC09_9LACO|nr:TerB N-terminal domain-containing protein [Limosilactobacillus fastidiosus]MBB1085502.1 TerB N-terminal domain-containing protein [Limosilactobacillus fastidiosus]MCD7085955.1 TerB N-terminal domain-containing protein [Limosilactobacillus fastidiosus]MCD7114401.1 TerB N-terminal domain-containing protein [Limosilactobacillus fastidiosus]MCD7116408.1 TerB N-terminal domain-containing protein [Limosilactobacillus fastidiosus]
MNQNDIIRYIQQQFGIQPNYRLASRWNACVFSSPVSGRWFALLIQPQGNSDCAYLEIHYGEDFVDDHDLMPIFSPAKRMKKPGWVGVTIDENTPKEKVNRALEQAFQKSLKEAEAPTRPEKLIYVPPVDREAAYHDQPLSFSRRPIPFAKPRRIPKEILKMNSLYDYTLPPLIGRAKNFYVQGMSVADYQDDYDYQGEFQHYFPVYHDMTTAQLRGYFTWRTKLRSGNYPKAPTSFVYVYLYELINQIGVSSSLEGYKKLIAFKKGYAKLMDKKMVEYLAQWLRDYVVYYQLGSGKIAEQFTEQLKEDSIYNNLIDPEEIPAEKVMTCLSTISSYQLANCPLVKRDPELLARIIKIVWQRLCSLTDEDIVKNYLGWQGEMTQRPFANAVFYDQKVSQTFTCQVDDQCSYSYRNGKWSYQYYLPAKRRKQKIGSLLHEIDRLIRQTFHIGRQLKPRPISEKILAEIKPAIIEARQQIAEERRPKIKINLGDLEKIRKDASVTRESLLTDEERQAEQEEEASKIKLQPVPIKEEQQALKNELGLSKNAMYLLTKLLANEDWQPYFKEHHLMVNIVVDEINDKLFDELGDTAIEFNDQDQPQIIDDYRDEVEEIIKED